jgi:hydrogenase expression/formation protein HypD
MKWTQEFRDGSLAQGLANALAAEARSDRRYAFMEFCGGHTHALYEHGLLDLLPDNLRMVHGPGCPVCVLPIGRLDQAIDLAKRPAVTLCAYGDVLRVPASKGRSLQSARAEGAEVRMITSALEAVALAREQPEREVVLFAIGFETTTPPTALAVEQAAREGLANFSVLCNHVRTPAAMRRILAGAEGEGTPEVAIDGLVGPGHVSTVIGTQPYEPFARDFGSPVAVAGFEPLDLLQAILMLLRQVNAGRAAVELQYGRAVRPEGNRTALDLMARVFALRDRFEWRGLGEVPQSALMLAEAYAGFDAERRFDLPEAQVQDNPACICGDVLRGAADPPDCKLFASACTPDRPMGSCMVSPEGACAAHYAYRRFDARREAAAP